MVRILLVDDHHIVRSGLRRLLSDVQDFDIVGKASNGDEALKLLTTYTSVEVVLMDLNMPKMSGFEASRRMLRKYPEIKIIILTTFTNSLYPYHLLRIGVKGYLTKECKQEEMIKAVNTVNKGQVYLSSTIQEELIKQNASPFYALSGVEMQIVLMLIDGSNITEIAEKLCLSPATIAIYRYNILKKVGAKNNVDLVRLTEDEGLLSRPSFLA